MTVTLPLRTVLFLTTLTHDDLPLEASTPACLLPFGHATFIERVLESLSIAGIKHADVIVCEKPEDIRNVIKDGWRWGIELTWHLAQSVESSYNIIKQLPLKKDELLLIGHGDRWVNTDVISQLANKPAVAIKPTTQSGWTGWMSAQASETETLLASIREHGITDWIKRTGPEKKLNIPLYDYAACTDARTLLAAQYIAFHHPELYPATWIRHHWGASSPNAIIHKEALIEGPALVGAHCNIGKDAQIGPNVVLCHDVLIAGGSSIRNSLVLSNTYVSSNVNMEELVVHGSTVADLKRQLKFRVPSNEAILEALHNPDFYPRKWPGQILSLAILAVGLPLAPIITIWQITQKHPAPWHQERVVIGKDLDAKPEYAQLRLPYRNTGLGGVFLGIIGGCLDILQGKRFFLGIRPRSSSEWGQLRKHWQTLFNHRPIGVFHAPEFQDDATLNDEALAVADAYTIVQSATFEGRMSLIRSIWDEAINRYRKIHNGKT